MPFDISALIKTLPYLLGHDQMPAVMEGMRRADLKKQQASQDQLRQAQIGNLEADNKRAESAAAMDRLSKYYAVAPQLATKAAATAEDPVQANLGLAKQLTGAAHAFGVDPALGQSFVPNMTQVVGEKKKKQARDLYAEAGKIYGAEALASDAITLKSPQLGNVKPSQLRAMFSPAMGQGGQPAVPIVKDPEAASGGSFDAQFADVLAGEEAKLKRPLTRTEKATLRLKAKTDYDAANNNPKTPARDRFSVQPVTNADGTTALVRVNLETGESSPIAMPAGVAGAGRPTSTEQLSSAFQLRAQSADKTLNSYEDNLEGLPSQLELHLPTILQSKQAQLYSQARDEFINAELRRESGAAIQQSEYDRFDRIYAVHPGDKPETIQQKREARRRVILGNQMAGGNLGKVVANGVTPAASHATGDGWITMANGVRVREKK